TVLGKRLEVPLEGADDVRLGRLGHRAEDLLDRPEGEAFAVRRAARPQDEHAGQPRGELIDQAGLADAGRTDRAHEVGMTRGGALRPEGAEDAQLALPSHEGGTRYGQVTAGRHGRRETLDRPGLDLTDPLRGYPAQRAEARDPGGESPRERPREDLARRRRGLQSRREVDAL